MPRVTRRRVAALCWAGGLQYFLAEVVTASAWHDPPYDWTRHYVSDLGSRTSGWNEGRHVSSPRAALMNASFVTLGVLTTAGAVLFSPHVPDRRWRRAGLALAGVHGLGVAVVGLQPTEPGVSRRGRAVHYWGALGAIGGGNLMLLVASVGLARHRPGHSVVTGVLGLVSTAASAAMVLTPVTRPGVVERVAGWPVTVWTTATGLALLLEDLALEAAELVTDV